MYIDIRKGMLLINDAILPLPTYEIIEEIGNGANARVFSVYNKVLNRQEALKIWIPRKGVIKVDEKRFYAELRKNSRFTGNDSIATIYTGAYWKGIYYCLMEYCSGITLKEFLNHDPSWMHRWGLARQISDTLSSIYESGIYHGDLHDKNIIVDLENKHNSLKILDLGTSIFSGRNQSHRRDAEKLYSLSFELLPCIRELAFYNNESVANLPSALMNKAFRAVINVSYPEIPSGQSPFSCPPSLFIPPDYSKLNIWKLAAMVESTPVFKLDLIEKFISDFGFGTDGMVAFYKELCAKIVGNIYTNSEEMISAVTMKYDQLSKKYL